MKTTKRLIILIILAGMLIPKISIAQQGQYHEFTLTVSDTLQRQYLFYEPPGYTTGEEWPVVFAFHGFGQTPASLALWTQMDLVADTAKFFIVYPYGIDVYSPYSSQTSEGWNIPGVYIAAHDDVEFVSRMIDDIIDNPDFSIDTNWIFSTGLSMGGELTYYLACSLSDRIASFAGVSAQMMYVVMDSLCTPDRPVSLYHNLGTMDEVWPASGGADFPPLEGTAEYWAEIANCSLEPTVTNLPDINPDDGCSVTLLTYDSCYTGYEVLCYRIEWGIHIWPGGGVGAGMWGVNMDVHTSSEIWKFFRRNPHPRVYSYCMPEGVVFNNQQEIDDFPIQYPNCNEIEGNLVIKGSDINDLSGLGNILSVGGTLSIYSNPLLENLSGLENLEFVGGGIEIGADLSPLGTYGNEALVSLAELDKLAEVGGELFVGFNEVLPDLTGLEGLVDISGNLTVVENNGLTSLYGLENIEASSIQGLHIHDNPMLSTCEVTSICDYLAAPGGIVDIHDNLTGCNDSTQVMDSCLGVSINEHHGIEKFSVSPNPSSGVIHFRYSISDIRYSIFEVYSIQGIKVKAILSEVQQAGEYEMTFDISDLPAGMYFVRMQIGKQVETEKLILIK